MTVDEPGEQKPPASVEDVGGLAVTTSVTPIMSRRDHAVVERELSGFAERVAVEQPDVPKDGGRHGAQATEAFAHCSAKSSWEL